MRSHLAAGIRRLLPPHAMAAASAVAAVMVLPATTALMVAPASAATACAASRAAGTGVACEDSTAPASVTIVSPRNGELLGSGSTIPVDAVVSGGCCRITSVTFYARNIFSGTASVIGVATSSPYEVRWTVPASFFTLTAVATDTAGNTTTSPPVTVYVAISDPP